MAMGFQHKQHFYHTTVIAIIYFSARGTPLNKEKDMLISVYTHWISLQQGNDSLVLTDTPTKGSAALNTELGDPGSYSEPSR